ncbi:hypothetical protein ACQP2X_15755 [Actinoplanes sp. CA-131856]
MSAGSTFRPLPRVLAVLLVVLASVFAIQTQASATARGHKCQVAFTEGTRQAVQCVDFNVFWNSSGDLAVQTLGASLCQATGGDPVRCAGIKQTVTIYATNTVPSNPDAHSTSTTQACGRRIASGAQCPASRQYGYSTGAYCHTTLTYVARIRTTFDMPITGSPVTKVFEHRLPGSSICYTP